jgi:cephalosporin hydroxylase
MTSVESIAVRARLRVRSRIPEVNRSEFPGGVDQGSQEVVRRFHELYFGSSRRTWGNTFWLGTRALKCPLDLWVYQEIVFENRPDVIVETGTAQGGSAHFLACICEVTGNGRVITIDVLGGPESPAQSRHPPHDRLAYLTGSSVAPETLTAVTESIRPDEQAMVILDSAHHREHVLNEMRAYSPFVGVGQYLIVEDTNVNGNPVLPDCGPGPMEAVREFLAECDDFIVDASREKYFMTFNPGGFLRRVDRGRGTGD